MKDEDQKKKKRERKKEHIGKRQSAGPIEEKLKKFP